ncbi:MAG: phospholipase D-like domain-containing protein, partial [Thermoprotei archaeon]
MKYDLGNGCSLEIVKKAVDTSHFPPSIVLEVVAQNPRQDLYFELKGSLDLTYGKARLGGGSFEIFVPQGQTIKRSANIIVPLSEEVKELVEKQRGYDGGKDIVVSYSCEVQYMAYRTNPYGALFESNVRSFSGNDIIVTLTEWSQALGLEDYEFILLPKNLVAHLEEVRTQWGLWTIQGVISKLTDFYSKSEVDIRQRALFTLYEEKDFRDELANLANHSVNLKEIRISSLYLDNAASDFLLKMLKNHVRLLIISRKQEKKANVDALQTLRSNGAEIRYNDMVHARLIIIDDVAAIVSSADLDSEGLLNQRQAGIYTFDRGVVNDLLAFFNK